MVKTIQRTTAATGTVIITGGNARLGEQVVVSSGTHDPNSIDGRFNAPISRDALLLAWPERPGAP